MAYSNSKGLIALPVDYSQSGGYTWQKLSYKFVQPSGISITPKQMQDIDFYRNGNGVLKRAVLDHAVTKFEWNTPYLTYEDKCKLIQQIRNTEDHNYLSISKNRWFGRLTKKEGIDMWYDQKSRRIIDKSKPDFNYEVGWEPKEAQDSFNGFVNVTDADENPFTM